MTKTGGAILAICVVLVALTGVVFGQVHTFGFINWDDGVYVLENPLVRNGLTWEGVRWAFTHRHGANWHPLTTVSHMLDCQLFGVSGPPQHLVNLGLHALAAVLLFLFLRQATGSLWRSGFAAALFAVHPLRAESVVWISERKDVLSGVFFLLTLIAYVKYGRSRSPGSFLMVTALFAAGLLTKPMLVSLPFVLLLLDEWPLDRAEPFMKRVMEKLPWFGLTLISCVVTIWAQGEAVATVERVPLAWRLNQALAGYVIYLKQLFWPVDLALLYPQIENRFTWIEPVAASLLLLGLTMVCWLLRQNFRYLLVGWLWYLVTLLPVIGIVQVGTQGHADRYTYLPHIGLIVALTWLAADLARRRSVPAMLLPAGGGVIVAILAGLTIRQVGFWQDAETLWRHAIAVTTDNYLAHANLAGIHLKKHRLDDAIAQAGEAIAIRPTDAISHNELGLAYFLKGQPDAAFRQWEEALHYQPNNLNAQANVAWVLATCPNPAVRDGPRAVQLMESIFRRTGYASAILLRTFAAACAEAGKFDEAVAEARRAIALAQQEGNPGLASEIATHLPRYEAQEGLRDPQLAGVGE